MPLFIASSPDEGALEGTAFTSGSISTYQANSAMEDRHFTALRPSKRGGVPSLVGVFDGHGGWQASEFARTHLPHVFAEQLKAPPASPEAVSQALVTTFLEVDAQLAAALRPAFRLGFPLLSRVGCCALVAAVTDTHAVVANAGDCRAIIGRVGPKEPNGVSVVAMSRDHNCKLQVEADALRAAHPNETNIVVCKHPDACYVKGRLQPTRALGDFRLKSREFNPPQGDSSHIPEPFTPPYINATPEIAVHQLDLSRDSFLVLACDGVWDVLSSEDVARFIANDTGSRSTVAARLAEHVLRKEADAASMSFTQLLELAPGKRRSYHDDLTIVVLYFRK